MTSIPDGESSLEASLDLSSKTLIALEPAAKPTTAARSQTSLPSTSVLLLLIFLGLLVLASPAHAQYGRFAVLQACRQQCMARYQMCAMKAYSPPQLATCVAVRSVCFMHC